MRYADVNSKCIAIMRGREGEKGEGGREEDFAEFRILIENFI